MTQEKEKFLDRWSRLKQDDRKEEKKLPEKTQSEAPQLPPVDKLTPESDFKGFMHPAVDAALRRAALKKLFSDPHFNVPDPYEAYSGDWTGGEAISEEMLKTLNQARTHLFSEEDKAKKEEDEKTETAEKAPKEDEPRRQDT